MRENMGLYRGKRTYNGEWVEGALIVWPDGTTWILVYNPTEDWMDRYEVDPSTVGEFTGLYGKDGKRIFEGDVVLFPWDDGHLHSFTIIYESGEFLAKPETETRKVWAIRISGYAKNFEVIGNVHDNPGLKEG